MQTRRQILQQAVCAPVAMSLGKSGPVQIFAAPDCLSQESAAGFRSVLAGRTRNLIVICGGVDPAAAPHLREHALNGGRVVWEMSPHAPQRQLLEDIFGIMPQPGAAASSDRLFVRYRWPRATLTRSFSIVVPFECREEEAIAYYGEIPVGIRRRFGRGEIVVLGSMLGPNLRADEPQSRRLLNAIVKVTTKCTSM